MVECGRAYKQLVAVKTAGLTLVLPLPPHHRAIAASQAVTDTSALLTAAYSTTCSQAGERLIGYLWPVGFHRRGRGLDVPEAAAASFLC